LQRRWHLHLELRPRPETLEHWPRCDGTIFGGGGSEIFEFLCTRGSRFPISCSGGTDPAICPVVSLEDHAAGELAAEHLIDCRLEHFAYYGLTDAALVARKRFEGFQRALEQRGYTAELSPVPLPWEMDRLTHDHWPKLIEWLRGLPKPVGIMAFDDAVAHDLCYACRAANIGVPDHVAIIGVNNDDLLCEGAWPPLSSIEPDYSRIGYQAAALLDRLLRGEDVPRADKVVRLPPIGVVKRVSTNVLAVQDPALADAVRYIREHACDPCSVDDVLREVAVGRRWLERQFAAHLGRTPHEEMTRVRIETAKRLLLRPELGVVGVAERCGFSKVQFNRTFRQVTGTTPAAYRRSVLRGRPRGAG
jgi:LacI family transcriptional regulator